MKLKELKAILALIPEGASDDTEIRLMSPSGMEWSIRTNKVDNTIDFSKDEKTNIYKLGIK